jgi:hypothetical protein
MDAPVDPRRDIDGEQPPRPQRRIADNAENH